MNQVCTPFTILSLRQLQADRTTSDAPHIPSQYIRRPQQRDTIRAVSSTYWPSQNLSALDAHEDQKAHVEACDHRL
jgi:hypothetical protein